jgi:osmotically-inducible protein OsmY
MKLPALALTALAALAACEQSSNPPTTNRPPASRSPDNTVQNKPNRDAATPSPMDQSNAKDAIRITADIRKALMDDITLSTDARNIKIITDDKGVVTLRGVVETQVEKTAIETRAKTVAGVNSIINQLEVKGG